MVKMHKTVRVWWMLFALAIQSENGFAQEDIVGKIDEFVEEVMSCGNIPGFALTLVKDGEDFYSQGYGIMDIESQTPVTNETLFVINSCTKAFAGVSLAIVLKNNPGIDWLMPVKEILGEDFYLNDTARTELVTIVDALAHRCGTAYNNEMRLSGYSLQELVQRLQYLDYPYLFRDGYHYNNIMYGIPALIAETLENKPWTQLVEEEIFQPLGMASSTFITNRDAWPDIALPHMLDPDAGNQLRIVSLEVAHAYYEIVPSIGGIASNALDMTKWIKFQLNQGRTDSGTEVLTPVEFQETVRSRVHIDGAALYRKPAFPVMYSAPSRYALGWELSSYREYVMHQHTGSQAGFNSRVSYLPEVGHGFFMVMNKDPVGNIRDLIAMYLYDLLLGVDPWLTTETVCDFIESNSEEIHECSLSTKSPNQPQNENKYASSKDKDRVKINSDVKVEKRKPLGDFVGSYGHHAYGNITVAEETSTGNLYLQYGQDNWTWDLIQDEENPNRFFATGREPLWYFTMILDFERESEGTFAQSAIVGFDDEIPPRFDRDLDFNNPPPPPQQCGG